MKYSKRKKENKHIAVIDSKDTGLFSELTLSALQYD